MTTLVCGPLALRPIECAEKGSKIPGHKHNFDHVFICVHGGFIVRGTRPDGSKIEKELQPGGYVNIAADIEHELEATRDHSYGHCIFPHRNHDGEVVEHYTGWHYAYDARAR